MTGGVAQRVAAVAATHPDALAVRTSERDVTYAQLTSWAGGLAGCLSDTKRSGTVLALVADGIDVAVAVLGAAAAGRPVVIVPSDIGPGAAVRLARAASTTDVIAPPGVTGHPDLAKLPLGGTEDSFTPVERDETEVVAFLGTSGSTGAPRLIGLREARFSDTQSDGEVLSGLMPGDRVATTFSTASAPVGLILRTLSQGATSSVLDVRGAAGSRFLRLLDEHRVCRIRMVPSVMRTLILSGAPLPPLEELRLVTAVGERLYWEDVGRLRRLLPPHGVVTNAYGLTETGLLTERTISTDEPLGVGPVDIGRPLPGRHVWIDSGDGLSAAPDVSGEIVVDGLLGAVGLAVEPLPDGRERYRTGDLGLIRADGTLMHCGRRDREVKVAGNRVDLGAVETAIRSVAGVLDVAVVDASARVGGTYANAGSDRTVLVAHVHVEQTLTVEKLRSAIPEVVLAAAIPPAIRIHHHPLPQLASGKLDVRALREMA